jgi:uncharacterized membrane protein
MFWILVLSYWVHLLATVVWFGSLIVMALVTLPALRQRTVAKNEWLAFQKRITPVANLSLVLLLITGFVQMTNDPNYSGFLVVDSLWAWAILVKHIAFLGLAVTTVYVQVSLYPAMARVALLVEKRPKLAATEQEELNRQEGRLLRVNLICAAVILFCTAVATAI